MSNLKNRRQFLQWGLKTAAFFGFGTTVKAVAEEGSKFKSLDASDDRFVGVQDDPSWMVFDSKNSKDIFIAQSGGCNSSAGSGCSSSESGSSGNCGFGGDGGSGGGGGGGKGGGGSTSCFRKGTLILDQQERWVPVESLLVGQSVLGRDGRPNLIVGIEKVYLGSRRLHSINGSKVFFTAEHPFWTKDGWRAMDPSMTKEENELLVLKGPLQVGHCLWHKSEGWQEIRDIQIEEGQGPEEIVFNLILAEDSTYWANGFLVHNKN